MEGCGPSSIRLKENPGGRGVLRSVCCAGANPGVRDLQPETAPQPRKTSLGVRTDQRTRGSRGQVSHSSRFPLQTP